MTNKIINEYAPEPFLKWVGGKRQLLAELKKRFPESYNRYYEPFVGGGAVLFGTLPERARINDCNEQLMQCYTVIRDNVEELVNALYILDECRCTKDIYYERRDLFNTLVNTDDTKNSNIVNIVALFIWLNKHCFNGLYRVNRKGEFNVPFNGKEYLESFSEDNLRAVSEYLSRPDIEIRCEDFEGAVSDAGEGDFVFFDSPYVPLKPTGFDSYTKAGFSENEHRRLARVFRECTDRGVHCILTNHDTEFTRELYNGFRFEHVPVRRSINRDGTNRIGTEVIIRNY